MSGPGIYIHISKMDGRINVFSFPDPHLNETGWCIAQIRDYEINHERTGNYADNYVSRTRDVWTFLGPLPKFGIVQGKGRSMDEVFVTLCALFFNEPKCSEIAAWLSSEADTVPPEFQLRFDWMTDLTAGQLRTALLEDYDLALKQIEKEGLNYDPPSE